jgi:SagB-type dehydrogenase family enzyme
MKQPDGIAFRWAAAGATPTSCRVEARIAEGPLTLRDFHHEFAHDLAGAYVAIQRLWAGKTLELVNKPVEPDISVAPTLPGELLDLAFPHVSGPWMLSRFACARRGADGALIIESPLACVRASVLRPHATGILFELSTPVSTEELRRRLPWLENCDAAIDLLFLLRLAAIAEPCDAQGNHPEESRPDLMPWEFHDLLFHNRSRMGRHDAPMGAQFRFRGKLDHQPAVRTNPWARNAVALYRPSAAGIALHDPPFSQVLESRRSIRAHNDFQPISAAALGEFLFRGVRNRSRFQTDSGTFVSRPYPSGGASYELEIYLTIDRCMGLERGFYYYDPENHTLSLIQRPDADLEGILYEAWVSCAQMCRPQILITIASRFQRVSWKYSGMAYATQLKNTGALFQTLYLVATAMNLAGCALGLGNSARFCRLARTNFLEESSIGEFMLGAPA